MSSHFGRDDGDDDDGDDDDGHDNLVIDTAGMHQLSDEELRGADIDRLYEQAASKRVQRNGGAVIELDQQEFTTDQQKECWQYSKLVKTEVVINMVSIICHHFRQVCADTLGESSSAPRFQLLLMIDNSVSMRFKRNHVIESVVTLLEVLRQLEIEVAVCCFGRRTKQRMCKKFSDPLTVKAGQIILQSLTFDDAGTYPGSALVYACDNVWKDCNPRPNEHRVVVMLTDGLTRETVVDDWKPPLAKFQAVLAVLLLHDGVEVFKDPSYFLRLVTESFKELGAAETDQLPLRLAELVESTLLSAAVVRKNSLSSPGYKFKPLVQPANQLLRDAASVLDISTLECNATLTAACIEEGRMKPSLLFKVGRREPSPPGAMTGIETLEEGLEGSMEDIMDALRETYQGLSGATDALVLRERQWAILQSNIHDLVEELSPVFEECVFPINKFTRRRAELRGGSLYLPGLIRALVTQFQYKKIFGGRTAGGKSVYNVCLALDISSSMDGPLFDAALVSMSAFIGALVQNGMENFSVITFGESVTIAKTAEQPLDEHAIFMILSSIKRGQASTRDADACQVAMQLLRQSPVQGPKKVFVFTDGFGNTGKRLSGVLNYAEQEGVEVVGVSVGLERCGVRHMYKNFIEAVIPSGLPGALREFYSTDDVYSQPEVESIYDQYLQAEATRRTDDRQEKRYEFDEIVMDRQTVFRGLAAKLKAEREINICRGEPCKLDVCIGFVLDVTGSMSAFFPEVKRQLKMIVDQIRDGIEKECMGLKLNIKFRVLGFRDHSDSACMQQMDNFTESTAEVNSFLKTLH